MAAVARDRHHAPEERGEGLTPRMRKCAVVALCRDQQWEVAAQLLPNRGKVVIDRDAKETCYKFLRGARRRAAQERRVDVGG